jgi:hypothetical protein
MCNNTAVCLCEFYDPKGNLITIKELKLWQKVLICFLIIGGSDFVVLWVALKLLGIW